MSPNPTQLLTRASGGDDKAISKLMPLVYDELRRLAASYLRRERPGQTLQATALVNEAYIRLISERAHNWQNRTHFLAIAALSMRQILVQRARRRHAAKRGGNPERITLDEQLLPAERGRPGDIEVLALDAALERLAALDERQAKVVELRYFGGLTVDETAEALDISPATVKRHWTLARAWLRRELEPPKTPKIPEPPKPPKTPKMPEPPKPPKTPKPPKIALTGE
jgi:RNA polymerase sigma-70 factor (ECF subfamily)